MRPPRVRLRVWEGLVAVAVVAACLPAIKEIWSAASTPRGFALSRHLSPGQAVIVLAADDAPAFQGRLPASRQDFYDFDERLAPRCSIEEGDRAVIVCDPGDDDDSKSRPIAIKLVGGPQRGAVVVVPRGTVCKQ